MFGIVLVFRPHETAEDPDTEKPRSSDNRRLSSECENVPRLEFCEGSWNVTA